VQNLNSCYVVSHCTDKGHALFCNFENKFSANKSKRNFTGWGDLYVIEGNPPNLSFLSLSVTLCSTPQTENALLIGCDSLTSDSVAMIPLTAVQDF